MLLLSEWIRREAKDQTTTTTPSTLNCDTPNQRKMDKSPGNKQFGGAAAAVDNMNERQQEDRPSIKFQLFSSNKDSIGNHQSSRNLMNNKNHNNNNNNNNNSNSVYNATTTTGTVLNGPSKLFRIPNLVRK